MKSLCTSLLAIAGLAAATGGSAQTFNRTYFPGTTAAPGSVAVAETDKNGVYFSASDADPNSPSYGKYVLVHADDNGNVLKAISIDNITSNADVIKVSPNGSVLVASESSHGNVFGIEVFKFDANLNYLWNTFTQYRSYTSSYGRIDLEIYRESITGMNEERYMIVSPGIVSSTCNSYPDVAIFLTNLTENGMLQWSQYYQDPNRCSYSSVSSIQDFVTSITQVPTSSGTNFVLSGRNDVWMPYSVEKQFCLAVDERGGLVSPFATFQTAGRDPMWVDLLWDGTDYLLSSTEKNNGSIPSPVLNATGIGLIRMDANFNPIDGHYYWKDLENYGLSIAMVPDGTGDYIISHMLLDETSRTPSNQALASTGLLRVDHASLAPVSRKIYNQYSRLTTLSRSHVVRGDGANFLLTQYNSGSPGTGGDRLIKTDASLEACGAVEFPINDYQYRPDVFFTPYQKYGATKYMTFHPGIAEVQVDYTDCMDVEEPDSYRRSRPSRASRGPNLHPTLLRDPATSVTIDVPEAAAVRVTVLDGLGRQQYALTTVGGAASVVLPNRVFVPGLNLVRVVVNGQSTVFKVNVAR